MSGLCNKKIAQCDILHGVAEFLTEFTSVGCFGGAEIVRTGVDINPRKFFSPQQQLKSSPKLDLATLLAKLATYNVK